MSEFKQERFDRASRWLWPAALVLAVAFALVELTAWVGATVWLWSNVP